MQSKITIFFLSAVVFQVPTWCFTPGQPCLTPNMTVPDDASCATYLICDVINHIWIKRLCAYPYLYSTVSNSCENFGLVQCRTRKEPMTPCEYIITCRWTPADSCRCEKHELYGDLDWSYCIGKPDGDHPYRGRRLSPFYIKCKQHRTMPTRCPLIGHFIFDHYDRACRSIFDVFTEHQDSSTPSMISVPFADSSSSASSIVAAMSSASFLPDKNFEKASSWKALFVTSSLKPRIGAFSSTSSNGQEASFGLSSTQSETLISMSPVQDTSTTTSVGAHPYFDPSTSKESLPGTEVPRSKTLSSIRAGGEVVLQKGSPESHLQSSDQSNQGGREETDGLFMVMFMCMSLGLWG